jgi:hypothetical protein
VKLAAIGTLQQVDDICEDEADDMVTLEAEVPDGWLMLSIR